MVAPVMQAQWVLRELTVTLVPVARTDLTVLTAVQAA